MKKILTLLALAFCLDGKAQIITTVAGNGSLVYSGDGGAATAAGLVWSQSVVFDAMGNMYIADQDDNRIRRVNTAGIITTIIGNGYGAPSSGGYSGDGGPATAAELYYPNCTAFDGVGNIYITDQWNNVVRKINTAGIISTVAGNGYQAGTGGGGYSGNGGFATAAELNRPTGIAFDATGNMYIADTYNDVIRKVNTAGIITTIVGNHIPGYSGDGGPATAAQLYYPWGVTFDAAGNLYIADANNNRIRRVNTAGIISTVAGNGTSGGSGGDGGPATAAELNFPKCVTFDASDNMYLSDYSNGLIRMVNTAGIITTIAGNRTASSLGDGGPATAAEINGPIGITIAANGNLYIVDQGNARIREVCFNSCSSAGIEQIINNSNEINIYPNPTKDVLHVACEIANEKATLTLTDMLGNVVKQMPFTTQHITFNTTDLNEGIYNISLQSNEGVVNKRVVTVK